MLPITPHSMENIATNMLIATAIMTHIQPSAFTGSTGPPGGGGGPPGGGGGNAQVAAQPDGKPMGALPTIFEGDHSKAESFIQEFSTYILVNHDVPALASFI